MGANRDMHIGRIIQEVEDILVENADAKDTGNIEVGTWVSEKDEFHVTLSRVNKRSGWEKRIAIPIDMVPSICALMLGHVVNMAEAVEKIREAHHA